MVYSDYHAYLSKTIVNPYLSDYVDDTFEVQVRTESLKDGMR